MNETVNDLPQLTDGDWEVAYTPILDRCRNRIDPETMVTVSGKGRTHDYIQICRDFFVNFILDPFDTYRSEFSSPIKGLDLTQHEIANARVWGYTPADIVLHPSHAFVRTVSRLYFFACKFSAETD